MKVIVTGASGFVAKNVRRFLSEKSFQIVSISRNNFRIFKNESKIISKDYSPSKILRNIRNFDVLIHLVGVGNQSIKNDYHTINLEFTKKIINLCKLANIKKIVFFSGLGVSKNTCLGYFISKYKSEQEIVNSKLEYTIFRPSYIIGKDDYLTQNLKNQVKTNLVIIPGSGHYHIQPISINDVTKLVYMSTYDVKFKNKTLDLVGPQIITYEKYVKLFCKNKKVKIKKMNLESVYYDAIHNNSPFFKIDDLNLLIGDFKGNHEQLKKTSNLEFTSIRKMLYASSLP